MGQCEGDILKKQAKALLSDHQVGQTEAVDRVSAVVADLPSGAAQAFSLRHAQQFWREYGFSSRQALANPGVDRSATSIQISQ